MDLTWEIIQNAYYALGEEETTRIDRLADLLIEKMHDRCMEVNGHPAHFGRRQAMELLCKTGIFFCKAHR